MACPLKLKPKPMERFGYFDGQRVCPATCGETPPNAKQWDAWKACVQKRFEEAQNAARFKEEFRSFDWTLTSGSDIKGQS
jgi:hypothetical protein